MIRFIFALWCLMITFLCGAANTNAQTNKSTYLDFTGDGKTDWAVIRPPRTPEENYRWKILANQPITAQNPPFVRIFDYGLISDILLPGDYTGDRKAEVAVRRGRPQSIFYVAQFPTGTNEITLDRAVQWGTMDDSSYPQGDYDGDGKLDYTVVRGSPTSLTWYILNSRTYTWRSVAFGFNGNNIGILPGADFTGDGRDELVFTANVNGNFTYYIGDAVTGALVLAGPWGVSDRFRQTKLPPADYTGDGKADLVAIENLGSRLVWYILDPTTNKYTATEFGYGKIRIEADNADVPVRGDYDGDGRFDIAVWRPDNQTFYVLKSSDGGLLVQPWGDAGDTPLDIGFFAIFG